MSGTPPSSWDLADLAAIPPELIAAAIATDPDLPLPIAIIAALSEDLDLFATAAADGVPTHPNVAERFVARCALALKLATTRPTKNAVVTSRDKAGGSPSAPSGGSGQSGGSGSTGGAP